MKRIYLFIPLLVLAGAACKKNREGGTSLITGTVRHHEKAIGKASVHIKFNAAEFPGADSAVYDSHLQADEQGRFSFRCYRGDYYFYATGTDVRTPPLHVSGGVPVKIRRKETVDITLAVTENH